MSARKRNKTAASAARMSNGGGEKRALAPRLDRADQGIEKSAPPAKPWWSRNAAALTIVVAGAAAYLNSFAGAFVFDDLNCITANKSIRNLWPLSGVLFPARGDAPGGVDGRPVVNLSLAINYAAGGNDPWSYHAVNLLVHLAAALTLFGLVRRTLLLPALSGRFGTRATPLAAAVAVLWVVHPVNTAAVTYVIQRAESLVGLFYLLTLYCVLRGATTDDGRRWYLLAVVACALGMATKEVMATAPLVVLLYDRTFLAGSFRAAVRRRYGLYLALAATWGVIVWGLLSTDFHGGSTGTAVKEFTPVSYLLTQFGVIVHYLRLAVWPTGLSLDYGWPPAKGLVGVVLPGVFVAGLLGLTAWTVWKRPAFGFLGACFFIILAPTSTFVPIRDATTDHRLYLSLAALIAATVIGGWMAWERIAARRTAARRASAQTAATPAWIVAIAAVIFALLTIQRNRAYASQLSIWQDTIAKSPGNARAYMNLGDVLRDSGQIDEALKEYRKALEVNPDDTKFRYNFGNDLAKLGRLDEAISQLEQVVAADDSFGEAHNNLGKALVRRGRLDDALPHYRRAVELSPDNFQAMNNLANGLKERGRTKEAVTYYRRALAIAPGETIVRYSYADALARLGQYRKALNELREAARLQPSHVVILNRLAWTLATCPDPAVRDGSEAVATADRAIRAAGRADETLLETLAAAYAEDGQFERAVKSQQAALKIATEASRPAAQARLALYQSGRPYREPPAETSR